MNVRQIVIGSIIIILAMLISLVGAVVMQGLSSKHRNAYIVQSAFIGGAVARFVVKYKEIKAMKKLIA